MSGETMKTAAAPHFIAVVALLAFILSGEAAANPAPAGYPSRPIRVIAASPAGSPPDIVARIVGERLVAAVGQPVVVENRPGAIGTIWLNAVAKATPDGYTFGIMGMGFMLAPSLLPQIPYTIADFAPVTQINWASHILVVRALSPWKSVKDLAASAKSQPGRITFASGGNATPAHISGELLKLRTGIDIRHVPFNGAIAGVAAVIGEQVDMMFAATPAVAAHLQSGRLRALATPAPHRVAAFPDLPTMVELGFAGFEVREWQGLVAPAATHRGIIAKMADEVAKVTASPEIRQRLAAIGMDPAGQSGPDAFGALLRSELVRWSKVAREAGMKAD
jgi:tripartite-type tricarboxylate transporter receptor subunit TctC